MFAIKKTLVPFVIAVAITCMFDIYPLRLSQFNYGSASVFPVYTYRNVQYGILGREAGEDHPLITAAREWNEEGLVDKITGLSELKIQDLIDIDKSDNTECII